MTKLKYVLASLLTLVSYQSSYADRIITTHGTTIVNTHKVVTLSGVIDSNTDARFQQELDQIENRHGDLLIYINSSGGSVSHGIDIINRIESVKANYVKVVCVVDGKAHSMAFNILSHCNLRLATPNSKFLVHKIAYDFTTLPPALSTGRVTAMTLRHFANDVDEMDDPFRKLNSKLMHLSLLDYDLYADNEHIWLVNDLIAKGYLHATVIIDKTQ